MKFVRPISGVKILELDETDGEATIAEAQDVFPGFIDEDFKDDGTNVRSHPTKKIQVIVHEMIKNGNFAQIFNDINGDLKSLCFTQPQIIQFVQRHKKSLHTGDHQTFFLFEVGSELFVAGVGLIVGGTFGVSKYCFLYNNNIWQVQCRHRVVVPAGSSETPCQLS